MRSLYSEVFNSAGAFLASTKAELAAVYKNLGKPIGYVGGFAGGACINQAEINGQYIVGPGWNPCTGVGTPYAITK